MSEDKEKRDLAEGKGRCSHVDEETRSLRAKAAQGRRAAHRRSLPRALRTCCSPRPQCVSLRCWLSGYFSPFVSLEASPDHKQLPA